MTQDEKQNIAYTAMYYGLTRETLLKAVKNHDWLEVEEKAGILNNYLVELKRLGVDINKLG